MPPSRPQMNFVMSFLKRKMYSKNTNLSLCQWQKLRRFQPENAPKAFGGPNGLDLLAGFKSGGRDKRRRKGKTQEGVDSWGRTGGGQRKERRGGRGWGTKRGVWEGEEKSRPPPWSFLKVGAYGTFCSTLDIRGHSPTTEADHPVLMSVCASHIFLVTVKMIEV